MLQLLHAVLLKRIHITKRDLFYTDVKLFVDQTESDGVLDDVATMIGCTRSNLHVVASDKGLVVGRISFYEDGDFIDCTKMGVGGKAIPPYIDKIENVESDAEFILLVEKEAAYMRMAVSTVYAFLHLIHMAILLTCFQISVYPISGRPFLSKISLYCHHSEGSARCSHTYVPISDYFRTANTCSCLGRFRSIWT